MIFLILAILVLILSFIIALYSLANEEKKFSQNEIIRNQEFEEEGLPGESGSALGPEKLAPDIYQSTAAQAVNMPSVATKSDYKPQQVSNVPSLKTRPAGGGRIWWEELEGQVQKKEINNEEDRSIEEIRSQLAQMISNRGDTTADDTQPVEMVSDDSEKKTVRDQKVFLGEISLSSLRKAS